MRFILTTSDEQFHALWLLASSAGVYEREDRSKAWSDREKRECINTWLNYLADHELRRR